MSCHCVRTLKSLPAPVRTGIYSEKEKELQLRVCVCVCVCKLQVCTCRRGREAKRKEKEREVILIYHMTQRRDAQRCLLWKPVSQVTVSDRAKNRPVTDAGTRERKRRK